MGNIICKCGHVSNWHNGDGCAHKDCACSVSHYGVLCAHIARLEAVVEAARLWRWNRSKVGGSHALNMNLQEAVDALDSTDVP